MPYLKLRKPLNGLKELRDFDPGLADLSALLIGRKPVLYTDFTADSWPYIKNLCEVLKLKYLMPEALYGREGFKAIPRAGKRMLLIGKTLSALKQAAKSWYRSPTDPDWGVLLGYPECCVKAYIGWRSVAETTDLVNHTSANTQANKKLYFGLNNVFNYFSRLTGKPADMDAFARIRAANKGLDLAALQVISWHPCAYDCRHSVAVAKEIFAFLQEYLPGRAAVLREYLAKPVLFRDKYEYVVLDGTAKNGKARYSRLAAPYSLLPGSIVKKLAAGNALAAGKNGVSAFRDKKLLCTVNSARPFSLLNFAAR